MRRQLEQELAAVKAARDELRTALARLAGINRSASAG
jgi:hypothetical protein